MFVVFCWVLLGFVGFCLLGFWVLLLFVCFVGVFVGFLLLGFFVGFFCWVFRWVFSLLGFCFGWVFVLWGFGGGAHILLSHTLNTQPNTQPPTHHPSTQKNLDEAVAARHPGPGVAELARGLDELLGLGLGQALDRLQALCGCE